MRICSFDPSGTELVYALGLGESLVGRSGQCEYPDLVKKKPVVVRARVLPDNLTSQEIDQAVSELSHVGEPHYIVDHSLLKSLRPDLIILDVTMPPPNGYDVCSRLKKDPAYQSIPIIMLSARNSGQERKTALSLGPEAFFGKPHDSDALLAKIKELIPSPEPTDPTGPGPA